MWRGDERHGRYPVGAWKDETRLSGGSRGPSGWRDRWKGRGCRGAVKFKANTLTVGITTHHPGSGQIGNECRGRSKAAAHRERRERTVWGEEWWKWAGRVETRGEITQCVLAENHKRMCILGQNLKMIFQIVWTFWDTGLFMFLPRGKREEWRHTHVSAHLGRNSGPGGQLSLTIASDLHFVSVCSFRQTFSLA